MYNAVFVIEKAINRRVIAELYGTPEKIIGTLVRTEKDEASEEGQYTIITDRNSYYSFNADGLKSLAIITGTTEKPEDDAVNHPAHYTDGKIEVIDFILDKRLNFCRGNAVKYIARAGKKDPAKEIEDLEKAVWYLNCEITRLKGGDENG